MSAPNSAWPQPPSEAAFYGLSGDIVRAVDGYSEADRAAVLVHLLAGFANAVGSEPHFLVGATRHHARLFAVIVGSSSKARKGTAWSPVRHLLRLADPGWARDCLTTGLSSGEGLIHNVRDEVKKEDKGEIVVVDAGISDKRLLVIEEEMARVLKASNRRDNILSVIIRQAWDTGDLRTMVKTDPQRATSAHVSVIGHITEQELRRELTDTETANGFANRFLWVAAKRSKLLPEPEAFDGKDVAVLAERLAVAMGFARRQGRTDRDARARTLWREMYEELSAERNDLAGAVLARAEAQVMRLALVYALLDQSPTICVPHLTAAAAMWDYCERTVKYLFGITTGDPMADRILAAVRRAPLTRTQISGLFDRHESATRIAAALDTLASADSVAVEHCPTEGRPAELWSARS